MTTFKQLAQRCIKDSLWLAGAWQRPLGAGYTFLIYHSVDGSLPIELDLAPTLLARQLTYLTQIGRVLSTAEAVAQLQQNTTPTDPTFVLTFDDGYRNFYTEVFPLLQQLNLPATLFVTTGFIEERVAYPMLSYPGLPVEPMTWEMLGKVATSGLVTLGAHTHTHPILTTLAPEQVEAELAGPLELFQRRLGLTPTYFAYPRAIWNQEVATLVTRYYQAAMIGSGRRATSVNFSAYQIPRLPIRRSDGWRYFQAKVQGRMGNEEAFYTRMGRWVRMTR